MFPFFIVISDFIVVVEVKVFEVGNMFVPMGFRLNIIFLIKLGELVGKSYSFDFIVDNKPITSKRSLIVIFSNLQS